MKRFSLLFCVGLGFTLLSPDLFAQPTCPAGETPVIFNGLIDGGSPTAATRLNRDGVLDTCGNTNGTDNFGTGPYGYEIITLNNISGASQCVNVALDPLACSTNDPGEVFLSMGIFSPAADPSDWSVNGLGNLGTSPSSLATMSADVPPGPFDIVVIETQIGIGCDAYVVYACDAYIPVELVSFNATIDGSDVMLRWVTSSETNNSGFEVQMMGAGDWEALGFVEGHGTTTEVYVYHYTFRDLDPGTYQFRLKQIDFDGILEYHGDLEVSVETPGRYVLMPAYPNPFNPEATVRFAVGDSAPVTLTLHDALGRQVSTLYSGTPEANQTLSVRIDGSGLPSGLYLVRLTGSNFSASQSVTLLK